VVSLKWDDGFASPLGLRTVLRCLTSRGRKLPARGGLRVGIVSAYGNTGFWFEIASSGEREYKRVIVRLAEVRKLAFRPGVEQMVSAVTANSDPAVSGPRLLFRLSGRIYQTIIWHSQPGQLAYARQYPAYLSRSSESSRAPKSVGCSTSRTNESRQRSWYVLYYNRSRWSFLWI